MLVENFGLQASGAEAPCFSGAVVRAEALPPDTVRLQPASEGELWFSLLASGSKASWFDVANVRAPDLVGMNSALTPEALALQQGLERGL